MKGSKPAVVVVGSIIYDFRITAERLPRRGETLCGYGFGTSSGGKGANQAVSASLLGASACLIGKLGKDEYAKRLISGYEAYRLDTGHLSVSGEIGTAVCLIHIAENGDNAIIIDPAANRALSPADVLAAEEAFAKADVLLLQNEVPVETNEAAVELAARHRLRIVYNPAPARDVPAGFLERADYVTPNETEAEFYTGVRQDKSEGAASRAAELLCGMGARNVVITLGGGGAYHRGAEGAFLAPPVRVKAVDTTAAGDAFMGALAVGLAQGMDTGRLLRFANAAGAFCAGRAGAQQSMGSRADVEALLASQGQGD